MEWTEQKMKEKLKLEQVLIIFLGVLFGVNGYKGPVFGTWIGDLIAIAMLLLAILYMRKTDQKHDEMLEQLKRLDHEEVDYYVAAMEGMLKRLPDLFDRLDREREKEDSEQAEWAPP